MVYADKDIHKWYMDFNMTQHTTITNGSALRLTPTISLNGNEIIDASSTITTSIIIDCNVCCLCFMPILFYDCFAKV